MLELKNVSKFYYGKDTVASGFTKVNLKLWVKIKEGWQDNDSIVKKFKNE